MNKWLVSAYALRCVCPVFAPSASLCLCSDLSCQPPSSRGTATAKGRTARGARGRLRPFTSTFGRRVVSQKGLFQKRCPLQGGGQPPGGLGDCASAAGRASLCICRGWVGTGEALPSLAVRVFSAAASASASPCWTLWKAHRLACHRHGGHGRPHPPHGLLSPQGEWQFSPSSVPRPPTPARSPAAQLPGVPHARGGPSDGFRPTCGPASLTSSSFLAAVIGKELCLPSPAPTPSLL